MPEKNCKTPLKLVANIKMHPRVKPSDISVQTNHEMSSFLSEHTVVEVFPDARPNCLREKEEMLKASEKIYSHIKNYEAVWNILWGYVA